MDIALQVCWATTIVHELSHLMLRWALGNANVHTPDVSPVGSRELPDAIPAPPEEMGFACERPLSAYFVCDDLHQTHRDRRATI